MEYRVCKYSVRIRKLHSYKEVSVVAFLKVSSLAPAKEWSLDQKHCIPWEHVGYQTLRPHPHLLNQNWHFNEVSWGFVGSLWLEKPCPWTLVFSEVLTGEKSGPWLYTHLESSESDIFPTVQPFPVFRVLMCIMHLHEGNVVCSILYTYWANYPFSEGR